jgi:GNAT superfamily N-acetyltransferase
MPGEPGVRRLAVEHTAALLVLRREALDTDPLAFAASVEDDRGLSPDLVRASLADVQAQAVFGSFDADALIGMVGVARSNKLKQRHIGIVWGMFVSPPARGRGAGRALLDAAIRQARDWGLERVELGVSDSAVTARRMYEAAGFRAWGRQPRALQWQGRFVDEDHMALDLRARGDR